jgi:hypothetical protein
MTPLALQAERLCWGLTLTEAGALAGLLLGPARPPLPDDAAPLAAALGRLSPKAPCAALGRAILARLEGAHVASLATTHPAWRERLAQRERPSLRQALEAPPNEPAPPLHPALRLWIERSSARVAVELDPRHCAEWGREQVLEVEQLGLAHEEDQRLVLEALGVAVLLRATEELSPRERALLSQRLSPDAARLWGLLERDPSPISRGLARLCAPDLLQTGSPARWGLLAGARAWALIAPPARKERALGLASRAPLLLGDAVRVACEATPSLSAALHDEAARAALQLWGVASRAGLTRAPVHDRRPLWAPPTEPLE